MWWLALACIRRTFIEPPGQCDTIPPTRSEACLVVPSLAGCTVDIGYNSEPVVLGQSWAYDEAGRLTTFLNGPNSDDGEEVRYAWDDNCLLQVVRTENGAPDTPTLIDHRCDARGNPISETVTDYETPAKASIVEEWLFTNTYDPLGQLVQVDTFTASDGEPQSLTATAALLWDGQGRIARRTYPDPDGSGDIDRDFDWDQARLLGWREKTDHRDPAMLRTFDGDLLVEQNEYVELDVLKTTTYVYDDAFIGPIQVDVQESGQPLWSRPMAVQCAR